MWKTDVNSVCLPLARPTLFCETGLSLNLTLTNCLDWNLPALALPILGNRHALWRVAFLMNSGNPHLGLYACRASTLCPPNHLHRHPLPHFEDLCYNPSLLGEILQMWISGSTLKPVFSVTSWLVSQGMSFNGTHVILLFYFYLVIAVLDIEWRPCTC